MDNIIRFQLGNGQKINILTDEPIPANAIARANVGGQVIADAAIGLSDALEPLKATAQSLYNSLNDFVSAPKEVTIELSVKVSANAGVVIAKAGVEGNFTRSLADTQDTGERTTECHQANGIAELKHDCPRFVDCPFPSRSRPIYSPNSSPLLLPIFRAISPGGGQGDRVPG